MRPNFAVCFLCALCVLAQPPERRPRALELGLPSGTLPRGPLDAITDVAGVRLGHTTLVRGDDAPGPAAPTRAAIMPSPFPPSARRQIKATTTTGNGHTVQALPIEATRELLRKYSVIPR